LTGILPVKPAAAGGENQKEFPMEALFWMFVAAPFVVNILGLAGFMLCAPFVKA